MKSTEVYGILRKGLASWCKEHGFKRTEGGMLGWFKPVGNRFVLFWFQVSRDGWDEFAGSKFIVEFQISDKPIIGAGRHDQRWRLPNFLTEDELEVVRQLQNTVITNLDTPPRGHFIFQLADEVVSWYRAKFKRVTDRYSSTDDIWLRYKKERDVERWATFVKEVLPRILSSLTEAAS